MTDQPAHDSSTAHGRWAVDSDDGEYGPSPHLFEGTCDCLCDRCNDPAGNCICPDCPPEKCLDRRQSV